MTMLRFFLLILLLPFTWVQAKTVLHTLPNGMKVLIHEDKRAPVASVRLWYKVGSVDEQQGKTGLSHALEHMMFKGTPNVPSGELSRRIASLGGRNNAYTNRSETVYTAEIAAHNIREVLEMEADRMVNLNFSDEAFINEMKVIREERRLRSEDNPFGKMWETLGLSMWQQENNRAPVIGYMADLHTLTADDLREWYRTWYAPNNAFLVVVGDVEAEQLLKQVHEIFAHIPKKDLPQRSPERELPSAQQGSKHTVYSVTTQPILTLAWRADMPKQVDDEHSAALDMLASLLSGSDVSRFQKNLIRGQAIALQASAYYDTFGRENALFLLNGMPVQGVSVQQLKQAMWQQLQHIAKYGVQQAEIDQLRQPIETMLVFKKDSVAAQADTLGDLEHNGFGYHTEQALFDALFKVRPEQVQAVAKQLIKRPYTEIVVLPQHKPTQGKQQ